MSSEIARELRDDYPAVDVTTVVFSGDFAGAGCCVIPQERVLAIADNIDVLVTALEAISQIKASADKVRCLQAIEFAAGTAREALAKARA